MGKLEISGYAELAELVCDSVVYDKNCTAVILPTADVDIMLNESNITEYKREDEKSEYSVIIFKNCEIANIFPYTIINLKYAICQEKNINFLLYFDEIADNLEKYNGNSFSFTY